MGNDVSDLPIDDPSRTRRLLQLFGVTPQFPTGAAPRSVPATGEPISRAPLSSRIQDTFDVLRTLSGQMPQAPIEGQGIDQEGRPTFRRTKADLIGAFLMPASQAFAAAMAGPRREFGRRFAGGLVGQGVPSALTYAELPEIRKRMAVSQQIGQMKNAADILRSLATFTRPQRMNRVWATNPENADEQALYELDEYGRPSEPVIDPTRGTYITRPSPVATAVQKQEKLGPMRTAEKVEAQKQLAPSRTEEKVQTQKALSPGKTAERVATEKAVLPLRTQQQVTVAKAKAKIPARSRAAGASGKEQQSAKVLMASENLMRFVGTQGIDPAKDAAAFYRRGAEEIERTTSDPRTTTADKALVDKVLRRFHTELVRRYPRQKEPLDEAMVKALQKISAPNQ